MHSTPSDDPACSVQLETVVPPNIWSFCQEGSADRAGGRLAKHSSGPPRPRPA